MRVTDFVKFIKARDAIRLARAAGKPKPWTKDPILQSFRFCNMRREDDTVTIWIRDHWRSPHHANQDLWFAMTVARLFNNPRTLAAVEFPVPYRIEFMRRQINKMRATGATVFNAAYIVSTNGRAMDKVDYVLDHVLKAAWNSRKLIRPVPGDTLEVAHQRLMQLDGLGSFMAAQVVADLKYANDSPLNCADDWYEWAASGPGSRRGLARVMEYPTDIRWREDEWRAGLSRLRRAALPKLTGDLSNMHAQDMQNCLCEFDKYERIRTGEGRPKQIYPGKE